MNIINKKYGANACRAIMVYILIVLGKYLQMMVTYFIFQEDIPRVITTYESFNKNFEDFYNIFKTVTGEKLNDGKIDMRNGILSIDNYCKHDSHFCNARNPQFKYSISNLVH